MYPLIDLINLLNWSFSFILNSFASCEIALLCCSFGCKLATELAQLFVLMLSYGHKSIVAIEDNGQAVDITEVAVILEAREGLDGVVVTGKGA